MSYNRIGANSPTIPLHLQTLFQSMNFLGSAMKDGKPCFNSRKYVDRSSYWGSLVRAWNGEKQSTHGNDKIRTCCETACQALEAYRDTEYGPIIIEKMLKLRKGLSEIRDTYERAGELDTVSHITDSIMIIDLRLPREIKNRDGLIAPTYAEVSAGTTIDDGEEKELSKTLPLPVPHNLATTTFAPQANSLPESSLIVGTPSSTGKKKKSG